MTRQQGEHLRGWTRAPASEDAIAPAGFAGGKVRGKLTRDAPLAKLVWFKSGASRVSLPRTLPPAKPAGAIASSEPERVSSP